MRISVNWIHEAKDRTEWQFDDDNDGNDDNDNDSNDDDDDNDDLEVQKQTL